MTDRPSRARKFRGFAVMERPGGALVWGTFRPTEDAARAQYHRWNPPLEGMTPPARVLQVEITVFDKTPHEIL